MRPILIAGIGNIFFGDDAFGVAVVQRLAQRELPPDVTVRDFGIRGFDLAYALTDDIAAAILVDAIPRGQPPGTLYVLEVDSAAASPETLQAAVKMHALEPASVLRLVALLGRQPRRILVVGCEPAAVEPDGVGLSEPVAAAVDGAIELIESLVARVRQDVGESL